MTTKRKPTQKEMDEAINPELSETYVEIAGQSVHVTAMYLRTEQKFIKLLGKSITPDLLNGSNIHELLANLPVEDLAALAELCTQNSGSDLTKDDIIDYARFVDIVTLVIEQVKKQGYLDFLSLMVKALKVGKAP